MRLRNCPTGKGLVMKSMAPSRMACTAVWISLLPVMTMSRGSPPDSFARDSPDPSGRCTSASTRSYARLAMKLRASRTVPVRSHSNPRIFSIADTRVRSGSSSSSTRIFGGRTGAGTSSAISRVRGALLVPVGAAASSPLNVALTAPPPEVALPAPPPSVAFPPSIRMPLASLLVVGMGLQFLQAGRDGQVDLHAELALPRRVRVQGHEQRGVVLRGDVVQGPGYQVQHAFLARAQGRAFLHQPPDRLVDDLLRAVSDAL